MIDSKCPIWISGKGFCWAPSAAWGCSDQDLCAKCQAKPRGEAITVLVINIQVPKTCRFCGKQNVYYTQWRAKDRMCSDKACWAKFIAEMKRVAI